MSTRAELKGRAKNCLRQYFMPALLVCIVQMLLTGTLPLPRMGVSLNVNTVGSAITGGGGLAETLGEGRSGIYADGAACVLRGIAAFLCHRDFVFRICRKCDLCRIQPVFYGKQRVRTGSGGTGKLFYGFKSGAYLNTVFTMFMMNLFIFLWSLLLVVPGIIKSYQYRMVPYIMAENPQMNYRDALALSSRMTEGHKLELFILELSFVGWDNSGKSFMRNRSDFRSALY